MNATEQAAQLCERLSRNAETPVARALNFAADEIRKGARWAPTHRHAQGGEYRLVARVSMHTGPDSWTPAVLYDSRDGYTYCRAENDFDARFKPVQAAT